MCGALYPYVNTPLRPSCGDEMGRLSAGLRPLGGDRFSWLMIETGKSLISEHRTAAKSYSPRSLASFESLAKELLDLTLLRGFLHSRGSFK